VTFVVWNIVSKSFDTNMATAQNVEIIANEFNLPCTETVLK
jgi:hypothetical protein